MYVAAARCWRHSIEFDAKGNEPHENKHRPEENDVAARVVEIGLHVVYRRLVTAQDAHGTSHVLTFDMRTVSGCSH